MSINEINRDGWDQRVLEKDNWSLPFSSERIEQARRGEWSVLLTSTKPVPREWFGDLTGKNVLGLASGGGQQGPIFAAAGARVTTFDASSKQLAQDHLVAERDSLELKTVQGYMHDLGCFGDHSFDLIFHPVSNCYAPEILPVWREAFRVLKPGGRLLAGFMAPATYIFDPLAEERGEILVRYPLPYSDTESLSPTDLDAVKSEFHTLEFSHSLEEQIGGQLRAGFHLIDMYEDSEPKRPVARYFPDMMATLALKPS
jgi:SAM-dependent methyltransferase